MAVSRGRTPNLKLNLINYDVVGYGVAEDENWQIIDSMVSQFIKINNIVGSWKHSTQYNVGDVVVDSDTGALWDCNTQHVSASSGSFSADRSNNTTYWSQKTTTGGGGSDTAVSRPENYGGTSIDNEGDSGPIDNTGAVQQAVNNALVTGTPLQLDGIYRVKAQVTADLDTFNYLTIRGNGGILCDAGLGGEPFLDVICSPAAIFSVTAIDNTVSYDFSGQGAPSPCAKLTLASGHTVTAGMLLKLISDDPNPGDSTSSIGEVVYVGLVSTNDVYVTARLRNTYTTNPRVAVYKDNKKVLISNITICGDPVANINEDRRWIGIRVTGVVNPVFERVVGRDTSNAVILTQGCVHALFSGCDFERGLNNITALSITGYGIKDNNGEYTTVIVCHGHDVRYVYTADVTTPTPANPFTYGAPYGGLIAISQGHNCSSAGFNTYIAAEGFVFDTVRTYNTYQGNNTAFTGIQAQGTRHSLFNCRHEGVGTGIVLGSGIPAPAKRHVIKNYHYDGYGCAVFSDSAGVIDLNDSTMITSYLYGAVVLVNAEVRGVDNKYVLRGTDTNRRVYTLSGSAKIKDERAKYDFSQIASSKTWLISYNTDVNNVAVLKDPRVTAGTNAWTALVCSDAGTPKAISATYNISTDLAPTDTDGVDSAIAALNLTTIYPTVIVDGVNAYSSAHRTITPSSSPFIVDINNCLEGTVVREYVVTTSGWQVNNLKPGLFKGQRLFIVNAPSSTQNFTVLALATNVGLVGDTAVAPKSGLGFTWNGSLWICTSIGVSVSGSVGVTVHAQLSGLAADDHLQYLTTGRADSWITGKSVGVLSDVPDTLGSALRYLRVNSGVTALEYAKAIDQPPARDVAVIGPATYYTDTSGLADASASIYALSTDNARTALRLFANTAKAIWLQFMDHALARIIQFAEDSDGSGRLSFWNAGAAAVKTVINSNWAVFGGSARVGTETVNVTGDLYVSGNINGPVQPGDYTNPYLIGSVRLWDSGTGLYQKRGADPANATDGAAL